MSRTMYRTDDSLKPSLLAMLLPSAANAGKKFTEMGLALDNVGAAYARVTNAANAAADAQLRAIATSEKFIADRKIAAQGLLTARNTGALGEGPAIGGAGSQFRGSVPPIGGSGGFGSGGGQRGFGRRGSGGGGASGGAAGRAGGREGAPFGRMMGRDAAGEAGGVIGGAAGGFASRLMGPAGIAGMAAAYTRLSSGSSRL
jgi:hypothetical protein